MKESGKYLYGTLKLIALMLFALVALTLCAKKVQASTDFYAEMRSESAGLDSDAQVVMADEAPKTLLAKHEAVAPTAKAEEVAEEKKFSVSGQIKLTAPYVSEWTGEKVGNGAIAQPGVTVTHNPSGAYVSALGYISSHGVDEVDLYVGKSTEWKGMTIDSGVGFYNVEKIGNFDGDLFAVYVGIDFPEVIGIVPIAYVEANIPVKKEFGEGGVLWKVGAKKSVEIVKQLIDLKIEAGGNDGIYGSEAKLISFARGTVSTTVNVFGIKLAPWLALQKGFGGIAEREWRTIFGLTLLF